MLYKAKRSEDNEVYGGEETMDKILKTDRFKPDKDFAGVDRSKAKSSDRSAPVEFEKKKDRQEEEEEDPFGLDKFLQEAKVSSSGSRKKGALDKIGKTGQLHAGSTGGR